MTICARKPYVNKPIIYKGVQVVPVACLGGKGLEAFTHTLFAVLYAKLRFRRFDIVHFHAVGPSLFAPLARLLGLGRIVVTIHARDYEQAKWGRIAKAVLRAGERAGMRTADECIAVSRDGVRHLTLTYGRHVHDVPNGPRATQPRPPGRCLEANGLKPREYVLFVGRLIPDRRVEDLILAAECLPPRVKVVVVGGSAHSEGYAASLRAIGSTRTIFTGHLTGLPLDELYSNAAAYVLPSVIEGLSLSLLEAMSHGLPIVASNIPGNLEALGTPPAGIVVDAGDVEGLGAALTTLMTDHESARKLGGLAKERVKACFDWDVIADQTMGIYELANRAVTSRPT